MIAFPASCQLTLLTIQAQRWGKSWGTPQPLHPWPYVSRLAPHKPWLGGGWLGDFPWSGRGRYLRLVGLGHPDILVSQGGDHPSYDRANPPNVPVGEVA